MMHKAIAIILFKLEGQAILRNPHFKMEERLLLDKIDYDKGTIIIKGKEYKLRDCSFPTVDKNDPYALTEEETELMEQLRFSSSAVKSCRDIFASCIRKAISTSAITRTCCSTAVSR